MKNKNGLFIVLDGGDGAGKTKQRQLLKEKYGDDVVDTREPGGSPYAEEIRNIILNSENAKGADARTMAGLFWAARRDHIVNTIVPALESGKIVICDRFDSSTYAYQIFGQGAEELKENFFDLREFFLQGCEPDLYIYMDVDIETGLARKKGQGDELNHFDDRELDFYKKMKQGFAEFLEKVPHKTVDANKSISQVHEELVSIIDSMRMSA